MKPERIQYRDFAEALLSVYRNGKAIAADKRLSDAGRRARVEQLIDAICHCTGARRRTVITSVLDSLRAHMPRLTLKTALEDLNRWQQTGISCFRRLVQKLKPPALALPNGISTPLALLVPLNNTG